MSPSTTSASFRSFRASGTLLFGLALAQATVASEPPLSPPYPDGLEDASGHCIGAPDGDEICSHAIMVLARRPGNPVSLVAARLHDRQAGKARWVLTDRMGYPRHRLDESLVIGLCERDAVAAPRLIAIVRNVPDAEWFTRARAAWRLDEKTERFARVGTRAFAARTKATASSYRSSVRSFLLPRESKPRLPSSFDRGRRKIRWR